MHDGFISLCHWKQWPVTAWNNVYEGSETELRMGKDKILLILFCFIDSGYHMPRLITKNRSDLWFWFLIPIHRVSPNSKAKTIHRKFSSPSWVFFVVLSLWATLSTWHLVLALGPCKWQKSAVLTGLRCTAQHNTAFSGPTPCFYFHSPESSEFLVSKLTHLLWLSLPIWSLNTADRYVVCCHDPKGACLTDSVWTRICS